MPFRRLLAASLLCGLLSYACRAPLAADDAAPSLPSYAEPGISPDHSEIAFVSGGDIWSVPAGGGTARLLADDGGYAKRPLFSPDGKRLAFVSLRPGAVGVYLVTLGDGTVRRLTHDDVTPDLTAWSSDGRYVYFATPAHNLAYQNDIYRVSVDGGTPLPVLHEDFVNSMDGAPSPDGRELLYVRNGFVQWWRRGHSHIDQSEITIERLADRSFETITPGESKDRWPMWSPDGTALYYVSDRSGSDQLWERAGGRTRQLTQFGPGRVLYPSLSRDGKTVAFERGQRLWTCDTASGATRELSVELRGTPNVPVIAHATLTTRFSGLALAPDDKKLAFVARGRIFAVSAAEGGDAQLVPSNLNAADDLPVWSKDSRTIAYVVDRGTEQALATYTFPDGAEKVITPPGHHDDYPHWSPDGKSIAFVRDGTELRLYDTVTRADRVLARGFMDRRPFGDLGDVAFSPAGDWIAYVDEDAGGFENVRVVPTAGGESRPITFLPNANGGPLAWAPDGTRVFYVTGQRTESGDVVQVDLVPRPPKFREDAFRRLFDAPRPELPTRALPSPLPSAAPRPSPAATGEKTAPKATRIEFSGIRDRLTMLQTGIDATRVSVTPDGKMLVLVASAANQTNLYGFSIDDTSDDPQVAKQLTNTPGSKSAVEISSNSSTAYYTDSGKIFSVDLTGRGTKPLAVSAELDIDFSRDKPLVYDQLWSNIDRWYADPSFHGANWNALHAEYAPYAAGARSQAEFTRILSLLLGELNSSHTGVGSPPTPGRDPSTGRLAVDWDAAAFERDGRLRVAALVPLGPLAVAGGVSPGDELLAVDGTPVDRHADLDELLGHTIGKRTELRFATRAGTRTVVVQPIDTPSEQRLRYLAWVAGRRAYVERISGGRIGYVHLADMGQESLKKFYLDLDVQNRNRDAVIVDIRNNEGGFVDPYAIDVLTRREYAHFRSRFGTDPPERTSLGQRTLDKPSALVVNEHSLSDAENFTEAYRVLRPGEVVGEPTAGWIIFTSGMTLADGSTLRLPSTSVFAHDGVNMELHPRPVDVRVDNPPGVAERGEDPQLAAAVRELEKRLPVGLHRRP
jgi:Tol biopolymer transport system component/C-terminal processing protease CtpA/Prc